MSAFSWPLLGNGLLANEKGQLLKPSWCTVWLARKPRLTERVRYWRLAGSGLCAARAKADIGTKGQSNTPS